MQTSNKKHASDGVPRFKMMYFCQKACVSGGGKLIRSRPNHDALLASNNVFCIIIYTRLINFHLSKNEAVQGRNERSENMENN